MWPYIQFRLKTLLYLALIALFLIVWHLTFSDPARRLTAHRTAYVNFKHLLIAAIVASQKGGHEVRQARLSNLEVHVKGKTKEGVLDVLTVGDRNSNLAMVNSMIYTFPGIKVVSEESLPAADEVSPIGIHHYLNTSEFSHIPDDIILNIDDLVVWIDPLDATKEYSEGLTEYVTTMVCVARKGEPFIGVIHQPFAEQTFWATKFGIDRKLLSVHTLNHDTLNVIVSRSHKGDVRQFVKDSFSSVKNLVINEAAGSGYKTLELLKGNADIYLHRTYIKKWDVCAPNALLKFATEGEMTTLAGEAIDYSFESDAVNKDGIFATAKHDLVKYRTRLMMK